MTLYPGQEWRFKYKGFDVRVRINMMLYPTWNAYNEKRGIEMGDSEGGELGDTKSAINYNLRVAMNQVLTLPPEKWGGFARDVTMMHPALER
jgi:hypothetical protein